MLRWLLGVTRRDRFRNEGIGVCDIAGKLRETRLRWYGHVQRREEEDITKRVLKLELSQFIDYSDDYCDVQQS